MKDFFCHHLRTILTAVLFAGLCLCAPQHGVTQVNESLSNADLYRLIARLEPQGQWIEAGDAYRLIAERDLAEIENLDRAIKNYIEAQKLFAKGGDSIKMYQTIADLGRLYSGSEYYLEAIGMFTRVQGYAERTLDTLLTARMLQQIGEIYVAIKEVEEASDYFERAARMNLSIQDTLLSTINRLTITAITGKEPFFRELPDSLNLDLSKYDSIRYQSFLPSIHLHVGMYNMHAGKYKLAMYYFTQGLRLVGDDTFVRRELMLKQSECYEKMNNLGGALAVMKRFNQLNDSINASIKSGSIQQAILNYAGDERETEMHDLAKDTKLTRLKSRMQIVTSYALIVGVVIVLIGTYIIIRSYQQRLNTNQIITKQNEEINRQKINELESNRKIESISSMLQGQEVERERIARDLHDSLGGLLSTVKLHFDAIQAKNPDITGQKEYTKAYNLLDAACNEVRTISNNMQPGALLKMGIVPAVKDLVNRIESDDTPHIEFIHYGELQNMAIGVTLNIFRIIQELLYNCLKHAHAKEILIQLIRNEEDIEIMVEDDGRGYDTADAPKGMGTENVAARVNFMKGEISIHSEQGVGTTTTITIPYMHDTMGNEVFSQIDPEVFD